MKEEDNSKGFFKKLNKKKYMPIIWLNLFAVIVWIVCPLVHLPIVWRMGLIFFIFNSWLAYEIGHLIDMRNVSKWWLILFPLVFALVVTVHYAQYNYLLCVVYVCMELFGLWRDNFYYEKK